jgi:2-hydroxy-6-oxonona-2,4-dienedioate hydrolase
MSTIEDRVRDAERRLFARYGVQVTERFVRLRGPALRIRVLEVGSGPPVVLLHPAGWFAAQWTPLFSHLPGYRLVSIDFPGHGLSDSVDYRKEDPRRHTVDLLQGLFSELGLDNVPVVGNSLGGMAALWLAIGKPNLVSRLIILGLPGSVLPGSRPDRALAVLSIPGINRFLLRLPSSAGRSRALLKKPLGPLGFANTPKEIFEIHYLASRRAAFVVSLSTFMQKTLRGGSPRPDVLLGDNELRGISQPVHFTWGADDIYGAPTIVERAAGLMPSATLEVRPGGHFPQLDDPEACGERIAGLLSLSTSIYPQGAAARHEQR